MADVLPKYNSLMITNRFGFGFFSAHKLFNQNSRRKGKKKEKL